MAFVKDAHLEVYKTKSKEQFDALEARVEKLENAVCKCEDQKATKKSSKGYIKN